MNEADFNSCINILAVEFLVKDNNKEKYAMYCEKIYKIYNNKNSGINTKINILMELNVHSNNLGEMITQGDYKYLKENLIEILDEYKN